jgi:hypothetical protein
MPNSPKKIKRAYKPEKKSFSRPVDLSWFYNQWKWRKTSKAFLKSNPICKCVDCVRDGVLKEANVSDHIRGLKYLLDNNINPYDWNELQPMNDKCHNKKSGRESHSRFRGMG